MVTIFQYASLICFLSIGISPSHGFVRNTSLRKWPRTHQRLSYYGESGSTFIVKEFSVYEDLEEIVKLSSKPLPERPDGIVTIAKFTSSLRPECKATEAQYERLARENTAALFLRCFEEYENAFLLFNKARIVVFPTFDIFYGGNRVGRVEGNNIFEVDTLLQRFQLQNSKLDLFSEDSAIIRELSWGDGRVKDMSKTPRTTARFIPGYDWDSNRGFFDGLGDKFQKDWDAITKGDEDDYGNWLPNMDDK